MQKQSFRWGPDVTLGYGQEVAGYINGVLHQGIMKQFDGNCGFLWMRITEEGEHFDETWVHDSRNPDEDMINSKDW